MKIRAGWDDGILFGGEKEELNDLRIVMIASVADAFQF
jgi:hypothetical protein